MHGGFVLFGYYSSLEVIKSIYLTDFLFSALISIGMHKSGG